MLAALASEAVNKVVPLVTMHFAATRLGAAGFGVAQFAMWLLDWGILLVAFGYAQAIPVLLRRAGSDVEKHQLVGALILDRLLLAFAALFLLWLAGATNPDWGIYLPAVAASVFILFVSALDLSGVLIAGQKVWAYSLLMIIVKSASLFAVWRFIQAPQDASLFVIISNGANGAICIGSLVLAIRYSGVAMPSLKQMKMVFRLAAPFALSLAAFLCVERFDLYLVERSLGAEGAGWYSGPAKLMQSLVPLIVAISTVFYSEMVGIHDDASLGKHLRFSLLCVMTFVLPLIVGTWFTGAEILRLIFGPGFESQADTLSILVLNGFAHAVIVVIGFQTLGLRHRMRPVYVALLAALLVGIIAGPTMTELWGYRGAAIISVASRWLAAAIILMAARNAGLLRLREFAEPVWRAGLPTLGMGIVLATVAYQAAQLSIMATITLGIVSYVLFFVLTNRHDARHIYQNLIRKSKDVNQHGAQRQ